MICQLSRAQHSKEIFEHLKGLWSQFLDRAQIAFAVNLEGFREYKMNGAWDQFVKTLGLEEDYDSSSSEDGPLEGTHNPRMMCCRFGDLICRYMLQPQSPNQVCPYFNLNLALRIDVSLLSTHYPSCARLKLEHPAMFPGREISLLGLSRGYLALARAQVQKSRN